MNERMLKLVANMPADHDAILITSKVNRQYYTEMSSSAGTLLVTREKAYFIIDFRYISVAKETVKGAEVIQENNLGAQLRELAKTLGLKQIGIESNYMKVQQFIDMQAMLPDVKLIFDSRANDIIVKQRGVKDAAELAKMREVQDIADKSLAELVPFIKIGRTEIEIARKLEELMKNNGAQGFSFNTICVAGLNSAKPHGVPSENKLKDGDFLTIDFGALLDGYASDTTRTFAIGHATEEMKKVYNIVLQAQLAAMDFVKAGVPCIEVDGTARKVISDAGYGDYFGHGLGHSVGLELHEAPKFNQISTEIAEVGNVVSVEPGIYMEGKFGVRIEDVIIVTEDGYIDITHSPKELIILK